MSHYIAVLVPERGGGWSVVFPDLPSCATGGETVQEAIATAASTAAAWVAATRDHGDVIPAPRTQEQIARTRPEAEGGELIGRQRSSA
jgi:predicted RNase H-like HicB family nuclease